MSSTFYIQSYYSILCSRMLDEEFERRAELEQLQSRLKNLLDEEREKREGLEREKADQEKMIAEERMRLQAVERSRLSMDAKLQVSLLFYYFLFKENGFAEIS